MRVPCWVSLVEESVGESAKEAQRKKAMRKRTSQPQSASRVLAGPWIGKLTFLLLSTLQACQRKPSRKAGHRDRV